MIKLNLFACLAIALTLAVPACQKNYAVEKSDIKVVKEVAVIQRGKALTFSLCGPCHFNPQLQNFSGKRMWDMPKIVGKVFASNITQNTTHGSGSYTPSELKYLLKTGIKKDGKLAIYMAKPNLADEDLEAIISFLKSADAAVISSDYFPGKTKYSLPGKFGMGMMKPTPFLNKFIPRPAWGDTLTLGKYIVDITGCYECHSSNMMKIDKLHPERSKGYLQGGSKMNRPGSKKITTPDLIFSGKTGSEGWTEEDFTRALREGINKGNTPLSFPMPVYTSLTDEEIHAVYVYLKSLKEE